MIAILSLALVILAGCATVHAPSELDKPKIKHVDLFKACGAGAAFGFCDSDWGPQARRLGFDY